MQRRVYDLALASLVVFGAALGVSNCSETVVKPSGMVQPLHATGQTNTQPPVIIDATLLPGTTSGGQQPITGTYTATPVGGASFSGAISGTVAGTFDGGGNGGTFTGTVTVAGTSNVGTFTGAVTSAVPDGCTATRPYQGSLTRTTLAWVGQTPTNTCNGTSPLTFDISLAVTDGAPEPPAPSVAVAQTSVSVSNAQQTGTAQVTANAIWTAASNQPWLTISSGATGGNGTTTLTYAVQANTGSVRTGTITIAHGSTTATLTVNQSGTTSTPTIATQPQNQTIVPGQTATLSVTPSGTAPFSYQWYLGTSPTTTNPIAGATASSYTTPALTSTTSYWVRVTNAGGSVDSGTAIVTVTAATVPPTITTQPQSQAIVSGQTAALSVTPSGTAPFSYQWYLGTSPTTTNPIAGATASSFTTPALTSTTSYWVRVTNAGGSVDSGTAIVTVTAATVPPTITTQPQSQAIVSGQTAALSVTAAGTAPFSYQWYLGTSPTTTNPIAGATASSFTTPALTSTTSYWVRVTNAGGNVNSATAIVTVTAALPPTITTQPQSQTIGSGRTATLSVTAAGTAPLSYQWYAGISPTTTNPIAGATASSYTTPALTSTTSYWVRVTNASGLVNSGTATITVTSSTISWVYNLRVRGTVVGTPTGGDGPTQVTVPSGTPLTINLSFDSATPNACSNPALQGGVYNIGTGNNRATINFLGYQYVASGGIEVGNQGPCGTSSVFSGLRLFVGAGSPISPVGTLVQWVGSPGFGSMFINGPSAASPGVLPTILPSDPFTTGGNIFGTTTVQLTIESAQIAVAGLGEPLADLLLGTAVMGIAISRRRAPR